MAYFQCTTGTKDGLHVPLACVIDYRGYRLIAESYLPLCSGSLKYGSEGGGKYVRLINEVSFRFREVLKENKEINKKMKAVAKLLNIKGHYVGQQETGQQFLYGPVDIEAHHGRDGRFYVLDFARVFPPSAPTAQEYVYYSKIVANLLRWSGEEYVKLLRPELLTRFPRALSSDAFSPFGKDATLEHDQEVLEATMELYRNIIPAFVKFWHQKLKADPSLTRDFENNLIRYIHRDGMPLFHIEILSLPGINVRLLGIARYWCPFDSPLRIIFLTEMASRVIKNDIRRQLREENRKLGVASTVCNALSLMSNLSRIHISK